MDIICWRTEKEKGKGGEKKTNSKGISKMRAKSGLGSVKFYYEPQIGTNRTLASYRKPDFWLILDYFIHLLLLRQGLTVLPKLTLNS